MQIAVTLVTDPKQYKFITENLTADKIRYYEKNNSPIYIPSQGVLMGLYVATSTEHSKDNKKSFPDFHSAYEAYGNRQIEFDEYIRINEKRNTFGRFMLSDIIGSDIENLIGNDPINKKNVSKIVSAIYSQPDYVKRLSTLRNFGGECVTLNGLDIPFQSVYDMDDPEVEKILNSDEPLNIKKDQFNEYITESVKRDIYKLPNTNFGDIIKSGSRVKDSNLQEIYAPTIKVGAKGDVRIEMDNNFEGLSESTFVARSLENRKIQELKKGQTPLSGYVNRQMVLASSKFKYDKEHASPDRKGVEVEAEEAVGRTTIDGKLVTPDMKGIVKVRSCINHNDPVVYKDEVSQDYNIVDGSNISINMATAFSEFLTQTVLSLKHGKLGGREFTEDVIRARKNGNVVQNDQCGILEIKYDDGTSDRFYRNKSARDLLRGKDRVKAGEKLLEYNKPLPTGIFLGQMCSLLDIQPMQDYAYLRSMSPTCLCISPIDGTSRFDMDKKGNLWMFIEGGGKVVSIPLKGLDELIFEPEGHFYRKGDTICTGVLDLKEYAKYSQDRLDVFYMMRDQCRKISPGVKVRSEVYEVIYKGIQDTLSVAQNIKSNHGDIDLFQRMYYGDVKRGINSYFKDVDEVEVSDSLILSLLLNDEATE